MNSLSKADLHCVYENGCNSLYCIVQVQREEENEEADEDSITLSLGASASDSGHGASDEGFCARCSHSLRHGATPVMVDSPSPTLPPPPPLMPVTPETFTLTRDMTSSFRPSVTSSFRHSVTPSRPPFTHRQPLVISKP